MIRCLARKFSRTTQPPQDMTFSVASVSAGGRRFQLISKQLLLRYSSLDGQKQQLRVPKIETNTVPMMETISQSSHQQRLRNFLTFSEAL
jgi:hypothetical protein